MKRLFVIGDSISIGYGPFLEGMLRGRFRYARKTGLEEALKDLDRATGANGGDSSMVLEYLHDMARGGGLEADVVLLNCGLHDLKKNPASGTWQVPMADYETHLGAILREFSAAHIPVVWVRITPVDDELHRRRGCDFERFNRDVEAYNTVADRVMDRAGIPKADLYSFTKNLGNDVFSDGVHFKEPVRAQQAAFLAGFLSAVS